MQVTRHFSQVANGPKTRFETSISGILVQRFAAISRPPWFLSEIKPLSSATYSQSPSVCTLLQFFFWGGGIQILAIVSDIRVFPCLTSSVSIAARRNVSCFTNKRDSDYKSVGTSINQYSLHSLVYIVVIYAQFGIFLTLFR